MKLIVHRGTNIYSQENSISGIKEIRELTKDAIIEIDIVPTKDNKLVLFHDFTLDRLLGIKELIFNLTLKELNSLDEEYQFITLDELLLLFPDQSFLLDIRCNYHKDYFVGSEIDPLSIKIDIFDKYTKNFINISNKNITLMCSDIKQAKRFKDILDVDIDLSENCTREYLKQIENEKNLDCINFKIKNIHIQNKFITKNLLDIFHNNDVKVFSTPSMSRSLQNSKIMLDKAKNLGCDAIWLSPIDDIIIKELNE